jgi:adenylate cyclase
VRELRNRGFDAMQRIWPQAADRPQVLIVDIDEESLRRYGQWPWPRTLVAKLVDRVAACKPAVLGVDLIFSEPDRLSAPQIPKFIPNLPPAVIAALAQLPSSESELAQAFARVPTVLGVAPSEANDLPPILAEFHRVPFNEQDGSPDRFLVPRPSMERSLTEIARAAHSEGSVEEILDEDGMARSVPLISLVAAKLIPALALEIVRVYAGEPPIGVTTTRAGIAGLTVGKYAIPADGHGRAYLHFRRPVARYVSAADVLAPDFDPATLGGRIVLLGVTGVGVVDQKTTPLGLVEGVEIHAQLIESILTGTLLYRPLHASWIELLFIVMPGLLAIGVLRYQRPLVAGAGIAGIALLLVGGEMGLFRYAGWLLDTVFATGATLIEFGVMLGGNFVAAQKDRRRIAAELGRQRVANARMDGELMAARAIQMGILPLHFPAFPERTDIDLYARIVPARDVGGDLFDFQLIDHDRLFFMIGDVSGKGIPAALFMAMTKELIRDAATRHDAAPDRVLAEANGKIGAASDNLAEDGANMMFVTAFAGVLDLASGELAYASAGHDSPLVIHDGRPPRELATAGGPPLGTVNDFAYPLSRSRLETGATLLLYTDGVTEAQNADGMLYTGRRLVACLALGSADSARAVIDRVFEDIGEFVGASEQADDITVLGIRRLAAAG